MSTIDKGPGNTQEATTRTVPALDGIQKVEGKDLDGSSSTARPVTIGGKSGTENSEALLVKDTGEVDLPDVVNRIGTTTSSASESDTLQTTSTTAANLIGLLKALVMPFGTRGDSQATSDTGTFSLIALLKRLLAKLTTQIDLTLTGLRDAIRGGDNRTLSDLHNKIANDSNNITSATFGSVQTNVDGISYVTLTSATCKQVTIYNNSGTDLQVQRNGSGSAITIEDGVWYMLRGITNAAQIGIRRLDNSTSQVTAQYEIES